MSDDGLAVFRQEFERTLVSENEPALACPGGVVALEIGLPYPVVFTEARPPSGAFHVRIGGRGGREDHGRNDQNAGCVRIHGVARRNYRMPITAPLRNRIGSRSPCCASSMMRLATSCVAGVVSIDQPKFLERLFKRGDEQFNLVRREGVLLREVVDRHDGKPQRVFTLRRRRVRHNIFPVPRNADNGNGVGSERPCGNPCQTRRSPLRLPVRSAMAKCARSRALPLRCTSRGWLPTNAPAAAISRARLSRLWSSHAASAQAPG